MFIFDQIIVREGLAQRAFSQIWDVRVTFFLLQLLRTAAIHQDAGSLGMSLGQLATMGLFYASGSAPKRGRTPSTINSLLRSELSLHNQLSYSGGPNLGDPQAMDILALHPLLYFACSLFVPGVIGYECTPNQKGQPHDDANDRSIHRSVRSPVDRKGISSFAPQRSQGPRKTSWGFRVSGRGNRHGAKGCRPGLGAFARKYQKLIPTQSNRILRQIRSNYAVETGLSHRASKSILPGYCISITCSSGSLDYSIARNTASRARRPYR
jgi:hypothetical protein